MLTLSDKGYITRERTITNRTHTALDLSIYKYKKDGTRRLEYEYRDLSPLECKIILERAAMDLCGYKEFGNKLMKKRKIIGIV